MEIQSLLERAVSRMDSCTSPSDLKRYLAKNNVLIGFFNFAPTLCQEALLWSKSTSGRLLKLKPQSDVLEGQAMHFL